MDLVKTGDGSFTLYSEEYKECYHGLGGALEEAFKKYVEPCKIKDYKKVRILDICFGIGYNSGAAIYTSLKNNNKIEIIALEKDKKVIKDIQKVEAPDYFKESYEIIKKTSENLKYKDKNVWIELILGDARKTIKKVNGKFDAIFLDPFSLSTKNKELWQLDFFKDLKLRLKDYGILSTYSCAAFVRKNLLKAGFKVKDGPIVGRRGPCTLASLKRNFKLNKKEEKLVDVFGDLVSN